MCGPHTDLDAMKKTGSAGGPARRNALLISVLPHFHSKRGTLKAESHIPCRSHAVPLLFQRPIHTYHAVPLPRPGNSTGVLCFTLATASEIGMLLITNFLELGVVSRQHAVTLPPRPCHEPAMALRGRFQKGIFVAWQGNGMARVNQTRPHCVNTTGNTQSKALVEQHGRGMAGERHGNGWYV
jgi:hypothetical protein